MAGSKTIVNAAGAFGYTGADATLWSESGTAAVSTAAVVAKQVVQLDPAGTVRVATTTPNPLTCGITTGSAAVGQVVNFVVQGAVGAVPFTGSAPAAGDILIQSATTAGRVAVNNTPGIAQAIGRAIGAGAAGVVDVWVGPEYVS